MARLVEFDLGNGETVLIEVEDVESDGIEPVSKRPGEVAAQARKDLRRSPRHPETYGRKH